ncbi:MAG TPA: SIP domain-containing protein [Microbacteriaceae bacterium]
MIEPDHATHTSRTAHHDDRAQYLVIGDETSLAQLQSGLALLPLCARGRVFVEVGTPQDEFILGVPLRMTVTWLPRSARAGRPGTATHCAPGEAVARAVRAWTAEMLCDGPGSTHAILTGDYRAVAGIYEHLVEDVAMPVSSIATPSAFGLSGSR